MSEWGMILNATIFRTNVKEKNSMFHAYVCQESYGHDMNVENRGMSMEKILLMVNFIGCN